MRTSERIVTACILGIGLLVPEVHGQGQRLLGQAPGQLKQVMRDALASDQRLGELQPRIDGNQVVFDVRLVPNPNRTEWVVLLNLTDQQFSQAQARYGRGGYTVATRGSISANGQQYHSAVWLKTRPPTSTLVLPNGPVPAAGDLVEGFASVDQLMQSFLRDHNATGATVAIARDGKILYERAFGWADAAKRRRMRPDTPMRIAGISKTLTAVAIMQLVEQGRLSLEEPVVPLLQSARMRGSTAIADPRWNQITVRSVLQHTAGWDSRLTPDPMFRTAQVAQQLKLRKPARQRDVVQFQFRQPLDFDPGARFFYSDFGYCLLGRILEAVADRSYRPHVRTHILEPAGMTDTELGRTRIEDRPRTEAWYHMQTEDTGAAFWDASVTQVERAGRGIKAPETVRLPDGVWNLEIMDSHAGWTATAGDLVRFVTALERPQDPLLKPRTRQLMLEKPTGLAAAQDTPNAQNANAKNKNGKAEKWYACGWWTQPEKEGGNTIWHGGGLAGSSALVVRDSHGVAFAVLFNTDYSRNGKPLGQVIDPLVRTAIGSIKWPQQVE